MSKPKVYITRNLPDEIIEPYKGDLDIEMWPEKEVPVDRHILLEHARTSEGLLTMLTDSVDKELLQQSENLSIVANMAVGYDNVDVVRARKKNVAVSNTPDVLTETTADLTFCLLMATARRLVEANQYIKDNQWKNWSPLMLAGSDIHGKTIGIVGMGRIGEAVAKRAKGFGMKVLYHNRSRKKEVEENLGAIYTAFDSLLEQADYVVCLTPLTDETRHMFDASAFKKMKTEAFFINVSRGGTMDEQALYRAITDNEIAGAGLDVFEEEPILSNHPLLALPEVICLPHIGSATKETRYKMMTLSLDNLVRHFQGKPLLTPVT
ncbi:glyoxylate reductase [Halobacillus karajensis]|uniref:Glyoxylate/hydroxypyruvate reductase B n=1 Tax=Halobacillus karajensis TaxID=195088 RepID=A0A024P9L8_9BACI|nr:D-glycerate dehydrogenase [Halobacillus karajensis]CDQ21295.1 Glyoxylate/hydroxypyruvate reductase B [Halobacillus karajensis]CDQ25635.1 Glyoxylate/hydroxypyruvate reductase B [Halobacillus karajensis]CDQ25906.1 Glyoxylate/hydroxypyruvate reductase B [Halobacillus karajensis]SEI10452.1 glyoxylate reductase [Halobacillus karajensis]